MAQWSSVFCSCKGLIWYLAPTLDSLQPSLTPVLGGKACALQRFLHSCAHTPTHRYIHTIKNNNNKTMSNKHVVKVALLWSPFPGAMNVPHVIRKEWENMRPWWMSLRRHCDMMEGWTALAHPGAQHASPLRRPSSGGVWCLPFTREEPELANPRLVP